jgi:hypothetical protein
MMMMFFPRTGAERQRHQAGGAAMYRSTFAPGAIVAMAGMWMQWDYHHRMLADCHATIIYIYDYHNMTIFLFQGLPNDQVVIW